MRPRLWGRIVLPQKEKGGGMEAPPAPPFATINTKGYKQMTFTLNEDQTKALVRGANTLRSIERNFQEGMMDFYVSDLNKIMCLQYEIVRMLDLESEDYFSDYKIRQKQKKTGAKVKK